MSKGSGMGRKRGSPKSNKGLDRCDATSHGKQCGAAKEVTKGKKQWMSPEKEIHPFYDNIDIDKDD